MSTVFQYVKMTGQPLVGAEIDAIVAQTLTSATNSEKVANALISKLGTSSIETKHKAATALIACMEKGHTTFRQYIASKSQLLDSALKPPSKFDDENDKLVMKVVVDLGRQIMNLMFEKQERREPPPSSIYSNSSSTRDVYADEVKQGSQRHVDGIGSKGSSSSSKSHTDHKFVITKDASIAAQNDSLQNSYNAGIETTHLQPRRGGGFFSSDGGVGAGGGLKVVESDAGQGQGQGLQGSIPPAALFTPGSSTTVISGSLFNQSSASNVLSGISTGGGYHTSGPSQQEVVRVVKPPPVIHNDGVLENRLIAELCTSAGIGVQPSKQLLAEFVEKVRTLDINCVVGGLVTKTGDENPVGRSKAFWVIHTLLFNSPSLLQTKPQLPVLLSEHVATLATNAAVLNNAQAQQKAQQSIARLQEIQNGGGTPSQATNSFAPAPSSAASAFAPVSASDANSGADLWGVTGGGFNFDTPALNATPVAVSSSSTPAANTTGAGADLFSIFGAAPTTTQNTLDLFNTPAAFSAPTNYNPTPTPPQYGYSPTPPQYGYTPTPPQYGYTQPGQTTTTSSSSSGSSSGINLLGFQKKNEQFDFMGGKSDSFDFVNDIFRK